MALVAASASPLALRGQLVAEDWPLTPFALFAWSGQQHYLLLTTYYLPLTTYYLLLTTLITRVELLALTTHYSLLTTHY